eukprot:TRINITY_DN4422_c0_g1_i1.p2 TRINITY_DN4422_c0_g1~~TRINITY_DN4422_c0_g1_i1.p2  ORF type:complete len:155 (+),score=22.80 TRINITY_DN4422_c0_g1_i1:767-1231(+)
MLDVAESELASVGFKARLNSDKLLEVEVSGPRDLLALQEHMASAKRICSAQGGKTQIIVWSLRIAERSSTERVRRVDVYRVTTEDGDYAGAMTSLKGYVHSTNLSRRFPLDLRTVPLRELLSPTRMHLFFCCLTDGEGAIAQRAILQMLGSDWT